MARARRYKKIEKNVVSHVSQNMGSFFSKIGQFFVRVYKFLDSKLTIMFVPHSQGKVFNIQTNMFAVIFGGIVILGVAGSFIYFNRKTAGSDAEIARLHDENRKTLASLEELRDENNNLLQTAKRFQSKLSQSLTLLGVNQTTSSKSFESDSDLSSVFNSQKLASGTLKEAADVRRLTNYLESTIQPVEEIGKMLKNQGTLFSDIPNIWPIKGGIGHVSMAFGQNVHPITQQWYVHKGIDLSTYRKGDPIIAAANGQVVTATYSDSYGNNVIVKHKHGIYTRYAHMDTVRVVKGQMVSQRDIIGTIGDTGITTGPHLHYEVHIGSDVVDPAKYINIK